MKKHSARRDFLKAVPTAAGALAYAGTITTERLASLKPADVKIGSTPYTPVQDYPIRPSQSAAVRITDNFWKPKIATNASVTIPFEVKKLAEADRDLSVNILEAAILSLQTHEDAALAAQVDRQVAAMASQNWRGNSNFDVAATHFHATGKRDLLDQAIKTADALYDNFKRNNPPFSGGERDAINCVQLYRATHDKKHLDLAKHYLDIRGLENSVNRSRHNQSYKPVLEQSEAVGHAVNCVNAGESWRYLEAAPVDQSWGAKWGCFRRAIAGARGTAVGTGKQNTQDMLAACSERGTAADLCANYSLNGIQGWYLPSRDELALMYRHLKATNVGDFRDAGMTDNCTYWTCDSAIDIHFVRRRKITSARFQRVEKLGPYFVHHLRLADTHDFEAELQQWLDVLPRIRAARRARADLTKHERERPLRDFVRYQKHDRVLLALLGLRHSLRSRSAIEPGIVMKGLFFSRFSDIIGAPIPYISICRRETA